MSRVNRFNLGVYAFLLAIALSIVLGATAYEGKQQLTAFVIGVPTIVLLVFLVLAEATPSLVSCPRKVFTPEARCGDSFSACSVPWSARRWSFARRCFP